MWRRSWLSREVLLFGLFAAAATAYAGAGWLGSGGAAALGAVTGLAGLAGITASACIYLVPARPAWNHWNTPAEFYLTGLLLGPLFVAAISPGVPMLAPLALAGGCGQLLNQGLKLLWLMRSEETELRASARLISGVLAGRMLLRMGLLLAGGILLTLSGHTRLALAAAMAGELLGRYLFFVSVTPKNMARSFFGPEPAA
jgi:DMSO reductase anchor subunit